MITSGCKVRVSVFDVSDHLRIYMYERPTDQRRTGDQALTILQRKFVLHKEIGVFEVHKHNRAKRSERLFFNTICLKDVVSTSSALTEMLIETAVGSI